MTAIKEDAYTLITGASKGLGRCFAENCAQRGRHLILVALPNEGITVLAKELSKRYAIQVAVYETDLTKTQNIKALVAWIKAGYKLDMLINNAGLGGTHAFISSSAQYISTIMQLNMNALVLLTHQLLPLLQQQKQAYILNIASLAAFGPMPYKTVYPASKAFVASFSRGLQAELSHTNIHVSVAYPGGMATNEAIAARMAKHNALIKSTYLSPQEMADICMTKTLAAKSTIVPGVANKLSRFIFKIVPKRWLLPLLKNNLEKELRTESYV